MMPRGYSPDPEAQMIAHYQDGWDKADRALELNEKYIEFFEERGVDTSLPYVQERLESLARDEIADELSQAGKVSAVEEMLGEIGVGEIESEKIVDEFERRF